MQEFRDQVVLNAYPLLLAGLALVAAGGLWLFLRACRDWRWWMLAAPVTVPVYIAMRFRRALLPLLAIALGLLLVGGPAAIDRLIPIDLGPRGRLVDGEWHLTLTGWDRPAADYASVLRQRPDTAVLQMANADVTDETLALLKDMPRLHKLDVSRSQVTDAGLSSLESLPALRELYLTGTKVTDAGLREALAPHPTLKLLDVRETAVTAEGLAEWKKALPGRKALR